MKAALPILVQRSLDVFGVRRKTGTGYILRANLIKKCIENMVIDFSLPHTLHYINVNEISYHCNKPKLTN